MEGLPLLFFIAFAFVLGGMYVALRRQLAPTRVIAIGGVLGCIITMSLSMITRPNVSPAQGIIMGIFIGTFMALTTLAIAYYFQRSEKKSSATS